jgi:(E)-4-hydroxy-3-methylbut-2-enyl-diphosphate synthase
MIKRRKSKEISIGNVKIGNNSPVSVQSMCNTDTRDVKATVCQINELSQAGCELVRLAVLNKDAAFAIKDIVKKSPVPLIADIHFDYRLAIECINNGISALRLNPGNIGKRENVEKVVSLAKQQNIPIRIGVNAGSLEKDLIEKDVPLSEKMVESALRHVKILESLDFDKIKISLKSSNVLTTIDAYRTMAQKVDYPLHLGVTEAGTLKNGLIKSSVGLGTLLAEGIGDTIRVSLTENPVEEVYAGFEILKSLGLRQRGVNFISCPTCGRTQIDLISLAKKVEERFKCIDKNITIATMGCPVNGPGEARHADFGIAGAIGEGYIFKKGEIIARVPEEDLLDKLSEIINIELAK